MKNFILILFLGSVLFSCEKQQKFSNEILQKGMKITLNENLINEKENTVTKRFSAPKNYSWIESENGSFGAFLENFPLKNYGAPILQYNGNPIATQNLHEAVYFIDTGTKDLQQCADAVMRLRAEYLWKNNKKDDIGFHFTSGDYVLWKDYREGIRPIISGNSVRFSKTASEDSSYENFRNQYLNLIFNYAGTISLHKETQKVQSTNQLKTGDILITPGSPGHVVFIAGVCKNKEGKKLFLLGEGFTPAQSIHVLKNPFQPKISPWYELEVNDATTKTARYFFNPSNFRSF